MRSQECREYIDKAAEMCYLAPSTVRKVKQVLDFEDQHARKFAQMATDAVLVLAKEKDSSVLEKAIASTEKLLAEGKRPTAKEVKQILLTARGESDNQPKKESINMVKTDPAQDAPKKEKFHWKEAFPVPNTAQEILFLRKLTDLKNLCRDLARNPNCKSIVIELERLMMDLNDIYGIVG